MKRDMDLIRELLLKLEAYQIRPGGAETFEPTDSAVAVPGYDTSQIDYNLQQLVKAGFIDQGGMYPAIGIGFRGLTWEGHEFLDTVRDPDVWRKAKARTKGVMSVGIAFIWEIAKDEVKAKLGLKG